MQKRISLLAFLFSLNFYGQVVFEKGYIIDNNNIKTNCLIKNQDWKNNPTEFEIKLLDNDSIRIKDLKTVKEFGIDNTLKYVRVKVKMDLSGDDINELTNRSDLNLISKTVFLRTLIDGVVSLYEYIQDDNIGYFYSTNDSSIEQLIYKKYLVDNSSIKVNKGYQMQLLTNVKCESTSFETIENLEFTRNSLSNYFASFNTCKNNTFVDYRKNNLKGSFNFKIKAGMNSSSLKLSNSSFTPSEQNFDLGNQIGLKYGFEFEYFLPFNKNKWAGFLETNYQEYSVEKEFELETIFGLRRTKKWDVTYKHLDIAFGARHYMYISNKSKLFINLAFTMNNVVKSDIRDDDETVLETGFKNSIAYGIGYNYNNKFSFEIKRNAYNILDNYGFWNSKYNSTSLTFAYTIFNNNKK